MSVFAVMNPIGNVPVFLVLAGERPADERAAVNRRAAGVAAGLVVVFALLGRAIFAAFGITMDAFRIAGGILLFAIAFGLLQGQISPAQAPRSALGGGARGGVAPSQDVAVTPLGTPIMAGPGTIATVMALGAAPPFWAHTGLVLLAFACVLGATYVLFHYALEVQRRLGPTLINVITRMMGLLLTVVAVQMAVAGVQGLLPALAGPAP